MALAVGLPTAVNQHAAGVLAGLGALYAGMASFGGVHLARMRRMLATSFLATALTLVACLVGGSDAATIASVTVGAFLLSIFAAANPGSSLVALQATGVLIVLSGLPGVGAHPLGTAVFVLLGGLIQSGLIALAAPVAPTAAERRAVADAYASLSQWIDRLAEADPPAIPDPAPFQEARTHLDDAESLGARDEHERLRHALQVGERIRATLVGWARWHDDLEARRSVQRALVEVEAGIRRGEVVAPELWDLPESESADATHWDALILAAFGELNEPPNPLPASLARKFWSIHRPAWPDSQTLRSLAVGHALRYTVALGLATAAYRFMHLSHGYWIPLTVAFVLRPDYATTLTRGLARVVGTVIGVLFATGVVAVLHPSPLLLTAAMLVAVWLAFSMLRANFLAFTAILTVYIVFSVAAAGVFDPTLGEQRLAATAIGVGVALVASILWPTWEAKKVREVLQDTEEAQTAYEAALEARRRGEGTTSAVEEAHQHARRLGLEAQRVVDAAGFEPRWGRADHLDEAPEALERIYERAARLLAMDAAERR